MSKNARKFQKPQASKHNARCAQTPDKLRYRDIKEAKRDLTRFRAIAAAEIRTQGWTTFNQKRPYECSGCKGYHLTSQELGKVENEVIRSKEITIADVILSA